jgi:hypothetical protein
VDGAHRRFAMDVGFALLTVATCVLVGRRLTDSSWPLAHAQITLVAFASFCYLASFVLRARMASAVPVWAAARPESVPRIRGCCSGEPCGVAVPVRLRGQDRDAAPVERRSHRFRGVALSIVSLGVVDAVAMLRFLSPPPRPARQAYEGPS